MVLIGERRPKQGHNAITQDLVHGPFEAVHSRHHVLKEQVKELARLLEVAVGQQLHGALEIGEQHRHLLTLGFQGASGVQDLLGQITRGIPQW
jgi:hypothetical protein